MAVVEQLYRMEEMRSNEDFERRVFVATDDPMAVEEVGLENNSICICKSKSSQEIM